MMKLLFHRDTHMFKLYLILFNHIILFNRAKEGHDSHCIINTWTPTRYIERIAL